ncbi:hypothetical protein HMPREF1624_03465 [Sporothrix schenckii ATCC 58251]|uniref:Zn(2)-C6 fungal-type domain-containing protein n=1 Tax=Sporothrix schenckii (strain ATCC 58251 / de Perez 2211183) TaxID=1391915 RepID=U7Q055_SPOS1|nr:hypothetical protein HMPREF1624_03465 [Sporothrix schenckii ATCC 58251]
MSAAVRETKTAKYPTKLRRNYPRSRNGCLTCRQRKKKCDETRPQCVGCTRNKLSCVWPARATTAGNAASAASSSSANMRTSAGDVTTRDGASSSSTGHPCPLISSSNLTLYQHKSRWQTYLPSLATWEGVEGCSVNLNPVYDEAGYRRDVVSVGLATAATPTAASATTFATDSPSAGVDDTDSVQPMSSSNHNTDVDDYATTATTTTADDDEDDVHGMYDEDAPPQHDDEYARHLDGDYEDNGDDAADEDEDAILAAWSPALASFTVDAVPPPRPKKSAIAAVYRRRQPSQQHALQNQHQQQEQHWQQRRAFANPRPSYPIQRRRVAAMTPLSASMLRHYIVEAAPTLATCRAAQNPYVAAFLPLAYTDDLVMHCILAIGGAHLSNRLTKPCAPEGGGGSNGSGPSSTGMAAGSTLAPYTAPDIATAALHDATTRHYTCVLRSLRSVLRNLQPSDTTQVLRVLTILVLLATYECLSWNILSGSVFTHLRASRQLIGWLRSDDRRNSLSPDERSMLGSLREIYAYQVLANRICPDGTIHGRSAAAEDTTTHDDEDFVADPSLLQDQECFGLLLSGLHGLFALIPPVSRLAAAAIRPQPSGTTAARPPASASPSTSTLGSLFADAAAATAGSTSSSSSSSAIAAQVASLRNRALAWQLPAPFLARATGDQERIWQRAIGEVYRHSLLIYLETIQVPGEHGEGPTSGPSVAALQRHIHALGEAVLGADLVASRFATILLWPLLIAGSILVHPDERVFLAEGLRASPQATWSSIRAAEVLEQLWARRDSVLQARALASSRAADTATNTSYGVSSMPYYGPHGIAQIMREINVNLCVG